MDFVKGLPAGVYVGQTTLMHPQAKPSLTPELEGFNLALHVHDDPYRVQQHRMSLLNELSAYGVKQLTWMTQTHSTICHTVNQALSFDALTGDALITQSKAQALMIMTADCLPVVLVNRAGTEVANLHAGWRGLADGIIENTIESMQSGPAYAWLGAAISQPCFEVGSEVQQIFCAKYPDLVNAFEEGKQPGKFQADLYAIARYILQQSGVETILGGNQCSYRQAQHYFSHRRDPKTGRMATFVFMQ